MNREAGDLEQLVPPNGLGEPPRFGDGAVIHVENGRANSPAGLIDWDESFSMRADRQNFNCIVLGLRGDRLGDRAECLPKSSRGNFGPGGMRALKT